MAIISNAVEKGRQFLQEGSNSTGNKKQFQITGTAENEFCGENLVTRVSTPMLSPVNSKVQKELLIGKQLNSINKKALLKIDTGANVNALIENFDKTCVTLFGTLKFQYGMVENIELIWKK